MTFAKTKIIATIGPTSQEKSVLVRLINEGVDVIRINSAHGSQESHQAIIENVRAIEKETDQALAILYDIAGPKIRLGDIPGDGIELETGQTVTLSEAGDGDLPVNCPGFADILKPGSRIFINDGAIQLQAEKVEDILVHASVVIGGLVTSRKGVNLPDSLIPIPALTESDEENLRFALQSGVDWLALSFVRSADNYDEVRRIMLEEDVFCPVVAKIETPQALDEIDKIIEAFDGCMVARGDLGVEIPIEEVPHVQKELIRKCNYAGKPVITATQMLESMIEHNRPTRAEAADVANAIYDGTDCAMLSGETAAGKYPVESVHMMNSIILSTEKEIDYFQGRSGELTVKSIADSVSHAVFQAAVDVRAEAIITMTHTGSTARMVSKYRPPVPIYALTPFEHIQRQLNLVWGVRPLLIESSESTDQMFELAQKKLQEIGVVKSGDRIVLSAGVPIGRPGTTNLMKVQVVGEE